MTRQLLILLLVFGILVLAISGWTLRAARWATAPARPRPLPAT